MIEALIILAHSWYPFYCCSERDCEPLAAERVEATSSGWVVDGQHKFAYERTKPSPDGQYHWCRFPSGQIRCFFAGAAV